MPLLESELVNLGLGDWWRSTFSQEERRYIELKHLEDFYLGKDELLMLSEEELEYVERQINERHGGDSLTYLREVRKDIEQEVMERYKRTYRSDPEDELFEYIGISTLPNLTKRERKLVERETTERYEVALLEMAKDLVLKLAHLFRGPEDRAIAKRFHDKGKESTNMDDTLELYDWYTQMILFAYRARDTDPSALNEAIDACEKQIALAPKAAKEFMREIPHTLPEHTGYTQLAIIREKQKDYAEAIQLATQAKDQGWGGDWNKRIERCKEKLQKQKGMPAAKVGKQGRA
jgi:hypothetical protein